MSKQEAPVVYIRIATIPESGSFEDMRRIVLESFIEMDMPLGLNAPPPLKFKVIADSRGCSFAKGEPPPWTVEDLNERLPGMYGPLPKKRFNRKIKI